MKTMTWVLCAVFVSVSAAGWGTTVDPNKKALTSQLAYVQQTFPGHEGIIVPTQRTLRVESKPDGIGFANAISNGWGHIWPTDPLTPESKFDDDDDCYEYIDQMCDDAGHGGAQQGTQNIATGEDGCRICSADCNEHGAVGFAIESDCDSNDDTPPPDTPDALIDEPDPV